MPVVRRPAAPRTATRLAAATAGTLAGSALLLAGCTSTPSPVGSTTPVATAVSTAATSSSPGGSSAGTASASGPTAATSAPASSSAAGNAAADQLAALAAKAPATLSVTYALSGGAGGTATVRIDLLPAGYRTTVSTPATTAMLISHRDGDTVSCTSRNCFTVARNGAGVPPSFDPQVQHVLTDYVPAFAQRPDELTVTATAAPAGAVGTCFSVRRSGSGPTTVVPGTYCLDDQGHVTYAAYPSGVLRLVSVNAPPTAAVLRAPLSPTPVTTATSHEPTD
ncbi:MAG: hypothetical protein QOI42_1665 [Frankiaceae bacterium]|nr:hypothetical protein [Frankiaceae bacterium]